MPCGLIHLMGGDATVGDSGRPESTPHSATMLWRAVMALFVVVAAASWVTFVWLWTLPRTDGSHRMVLYYYWRHTSLWWSGVVLAAAGVLSLILVAGLLVQILRHVHGRWRVVTMALGAGAWLCGAACLAVLGLVAVLAAGFEGTQTIARASDGTMVMITQDGFDGDRVGVWRPVTSVTFVEDLHVSTVNPRSGPCRLDRETESQMRLTCGSTSQLMSADMRRP